VHKLRHATIKGVVMLSDEEKAKIEAEEKYRQELRGKAPPVNTTSFTDKMNKFGFYLWLFIVVPVMLGLLSTCVYINSK
jgi:hypothetical protein